MCLNFAFPSCVLHGQSFITDEISILCGECLQLGYGRMRSYHSGLKVGIGEVLVILWRRGLVATAVNRPRVTSAEMVQLLSQWYWSVWPTRSQAGWLAGWLACWQAVHLLLQAGEQAAKWRSPCWESHTVRHSHTPGITSLPHPVPTSDKIFLDFLQLHPATLSVYCPNRWIIYLRIKDPYKVLRT